MNNTVTHIFESSYISVVVKHKCIERLQELMDAYYDEEKDVTGIKGNRLAELSGIHQGTISRILSGDSLVPSAEKIYALALFFNVNPAYIYGWTDEMQKLNLSEIRKSLMKATVRALELHRGKDIKFQARMVLAFYLREAGIPEDEILEELARIS